jgi:hypothetical protein
LAFVLLLLIPPTLQAELKLENVRFTYGVLGPTRPDGKVLPGEELILAFTMTGLAKDAAGQISTSLAAELLDEGGKSVAKSPEKTVKAVLALGGADMPGVLTFGLSDDFRPGKYVMRGVLKDLLAGAEARTERTIEVAPPELGIVRLRLANDSEGQSASGGNVTIGQTVHLQCRAVGFARKEKRIQLTGSMRVVDAAGKATYPSPLSFSLDQSVPDEVSHASFKFSVSANRAGRFTVQIEVQDKVTGKTVSQQLPIVVHTAPESGQK